LKWFPLSRGVIVLDDFPQGIPPLNTSLILEMPIGQLWKRPEAVFLNF
jgi:hypothetical protein